MGVCLNVISDMHMVLRAIVGSTFLCLEAELAEIVHETYKVYY